MWRGEGAMGSECSLSQGSWGIMGDTPLMPRPTEPSEGLGTGHPVPEPPSVAP